MQAALVAIWVSVALGAGIGAWQRFTPEATGPVRSFALVAAGSVVALSLLPHALLSKGALGLLVAVLGFYAIPAVDWLLRRGIERLPQRSPRLAVTYAGLLIHRIGDGVALSVDGHGLDVLFALGAHEVPIVALVVAMSAAEGLPKALGRAGLLGLASTLGCVLVRALPGPLWHDWHGWVDALSAGILGHVIVHELATERLHRTGQKALDIGAAGLGLVLVCLPAAEAESELPLAQLLFARLLAAAMPVLLGLTITALLQRYTPSMSGWFARGPQPLGAGEARPDTIALSISSLGWPFALARTAGALVLAGLMLFSSRAASSHPSGVDDATRERAWPVSRPSGARFWSVLDDWVLATAAPLLLGLLVATYVEAFLPALPPQGPLWHGAQGAAMLGLCALGLALTARLSAAAATPIAAGLIAKGMPPALTLGALFLGAAINVFVVGSWRRSGASRRWLVLGALGSGALGVAVLPLELGPVPFMAGPAWLSWLSLGGLSALLARQIWNVGVRHWLGTSLSTARAGAELEHHPGHAH